MREALKDFVPSIRIHVVRDGREAMCFLGRSEEFVSAPRPEMMFLDYHLPKTDPRCILQFVKQSKHLREIPVIVLTNSKAEELMQEAYGLGANCYLSKPLELDEFYRMVRAAATFWLNYRADS